MLKCEYTSVWDSGEIVTTPCLYDPETGRTEPEVSKAEPPTGVPIREYITLESEEELDVCLDCHEYVLRTVVGDRADLSYGEIKECPNPDCPDTDITS